MQVAYRVRGVEKTIYCAKPAQRERFEFSVTTAFQKLAKARLSAYSLYMGYRTIVVSDEAYTRLKKRKEPGESFNDVILRELPPLADTCGEVLDSLRDYPAPRPDPKLIKAVINGRSRRSNRK